ncbi:MAG: PAS domain S-box protein [Deltaproteobacteria bacterium]|nr:PAS domain S-box protein [Deltaproteobacteria bacterium]
MEKKTARFEEGIMSYAPKILIVDDEPRMCDSLDVLLSGAGYETHTGNSGKDAIEHLAKNSFDLVLLDIVMPEMEGRQVMHYMNSQDLDTLVIVMTGHASIESAIEVLRSGAYDYLRKPFEHEELLKTVENALEQKRLKTERKQIEEALRESEEKYKTLIENSLTGIFIHQDGKYVFVNDRFAEIHSYKPEELVGMEYLILIPPDEREALRQIAQKRLEGTSVSPRYEVQRFRKDGTSIWCEMMATRIEYRGRPAIMGNIVDITKRKRAEEGLRESEKRLYQERRRMDLLKFANDVALKLMHELRNPLVAVGGFSRRISSREYPDDKLKEYARIIFQESTRLENVLNDVLAHLKSAAKQAGPLPGSKDSPEASAPP